MQGLGGSQENGSGARADDDGPIIRFAMNARAGRMRSRGVFVWVSCRPEQPTSAPGVLRKMHSNRPG